MAADGAVLSERAKHRLRLAAGLLRGDGVAFDCPRDQFYDAVQRALAGLAPENRDALRAQVDWLEEYDRAGGADGTESAPRMRQRRQNKPARRE